MRLSFSLGSRQAGCRRKGMEVGTSCTHFQQYLSAIDLQVCPLLFGILDVVCIRLPERALLPAFGEAHAAELTEIKAVQKFEETLTPERLGRDVLQQIAQDCEDAEHVV